jgi:hypothetical protein
VESLEVAATTDFRASAVVADRIDCIHDSIIQKRNAPKPPNDLSTLRHLLAIFTVIVDLDADFFCPRRGAQVDRGIRRLLKSAPIIEHYSLIQRYESERFHQHFVASGDRIVCVTAVAPLASAISKKLIPKKHNIIDECIGVPVASIIVQKVCGAILLHGLTGLCPLRQMNFCIFLLSLKFNIHF